MVDSTTATDQSVRGCFDNAMPGGNQKQSNSAVAIISLAGFINYLRDLNEVNGRGRTERHQAPAPSLSDKPCRDKQPPPGASTETAFQLLRRPRSPGTPISSRPARRA